MCRLADGQETNDDFLTVREELRAVMVEGVVSGESILWGGGRQQVSD